MHTHVQMSEVIFLIFFLNSKLISLHGLSQTSIFISFCLELWTCLEVLETMSCNSFLKCLRTSEPGDSEVVTVKEFASFANMIYLVLHLFIHITNVYQGCFWCPDKSGNRQLGPSSLAVYFLQANGCAYVEEQMLGAFILNCAHHEDQLHAPFP